MIKELIAELALSYVGETEIKGNMGFNNPEFEEKMRIMGFKDREAWCSLFTKMIWEYSYAGHDSTQIEVLDRLFSKSATKTWNNFNKSTFRTSQIPEQGDVVIWQTYKKGKAHWTGHAGIVIEVDLKRNFINTVEGNGNKDGGREGKEVVIKSRKLDFKTQNGLRMLGFIKPKI